MLLLFTKTAVKLLFLLPFSEETFLFKLLNYISGRSVSVCRFHWVGFNKLLIIILFNLFLFLFLLSNIFNFEILKLKGRIKTIGLNWKVKKNQLNHSMHLLFLFTDREHSTWSANKWLEVKVCSCSLLSNGAGFAANKNSTYA